MHLKGIMQKIAAFLMSSVLLVPFAASAANSTAQNIGLLGAGVGLGVLLSQALNNSANNTCKGCQNIDASKPNYCATITCSTDSNGYTITGKCGAPGECKATQAQGMGGSSINLGTALQVVGLVATLAQLSQSQSGAAAPSGSAPTTGCATFYSVTTPSADPCAIYNPNPVSNTIASTPISDFGDTSTASSVSDALLNLINGGEATRSGTTTDLATQLQDLANGSSATHTDASGAKSLQLNGDLSDAKAGEVKLGSAGATIVANVREGLTEVAGFFGSNFSGSAQQSFAGNLCAARPWAKGFLAKILPPWVLDGVCQKLGYQVGVVEATGPSFEKHQITPGNGGVIQVEKKPAAAPAEVDIWADPASVRLNTRTKVFWSSSNVDSCAIKGPSFEQSSLSGGGATVPITGPTTFTITCATPDGKEVSDNVTVHLAI